MKHCNTLLLLFLLIKSGVTGVKSSDWRNDNQQESKTPLQHIHIGATFPMAGGWAGGLGSLPAALMAFDDVNNRTDLLPEYYLNLHWNDSKCTPGMGASDMFNFYNNPKKLMLLCGCSTVCATIAEAAKRWNVVVVGYGASLPALSNRQRFPTFFRTHPSATAHNPTRIKLFKMFGWSRIAIIQEAEGLFISTGEDLEAKCKENGIEIITRQSFLTDPSDAVRNLARQNARIIVGLFYEDSARRVMCEAYKRKLYGKQFVWFMIGWYRDNWYIMPEESVNCTPKQMKEVVEGHITTEALLLNQDNMPTISTMTSQQFLERFDRSLVKYNLETRKPAGYMEAPLAYDAVWALALALNKTMMTLKSRGLKLEDFTYSNSLITEMIYTAMKNTSFLGVSGYVRFSATGDRLAWTQVEQMINGKYNMLGMFDSHTSNFTWNHKETFPGGKPPKDRPLTVDVYHYIYLSLICLGSISLIGIVLVIFILIFNRRNSNRRRQMRLTNLSGTYQN